MTLEGIVPVLTIPFRGDDSVDEDALRQEINFTIAKGAAAVGALGITSEVFKLTDAERFRITEIVVEECAGRVPTVIAAGAGSVYSTLQFTRFAEKAGASVLLVMPPPTSSLSDGGMLDFFEQVLTSVSVPVMIHDTDISGGVPSGVFLRLADKHPNLLYVKLGIPLAGAKCAEIIRSSEGRLKVFYGLGGIAMFDGLAHGASGFMPGTALTDFYSKVHRLYAAGNLAEAKRQFTALVPLLTFASQHVELALFLEKRILEKRGVIPCSRLRPPTLSFDEAYQEEIEEFVDYGLALCKESKSAASPPA